MRKIIAFAAAGMLALALAASVGAADARTGYTINETGRMTADADLYRHHWDVPGRLNLQCKAKKSSIVRAVNKITWLNGEKLIHLRTKYCDGWTYARNFKKN